jgi:hypothetical protein
MRLKDLDITNLSQDDKSYIITIYLYNFSQDELYENKQYTEMWNALKIKYKQ